MLTLLYRYCANPIQVQSGVYSRELYWNHETKRHLLKWVPDGPTCSRYVVPVGTVIDIYCDDSQFQVSVVAAWDGVGRPPMPYTLEEGIPAGRTAYRLEYVKNGPACNDGQGGGNCGLKITDVQQVYDQVSGTYTITVFTAGYNGPIEYTINNFHDVQDSNVFTGLKVSEPFEGVYRPANYVVKARPKQL